MISRFIYIELFFVDKSLSIHRYLEHEILPIRAISKKRNGGLGNGKIYKKGNDKIEQPIKNSFTPTKELYWKY